MNPRTKVHSSGNIAFSREDKPEMQKALHHHHHHHCSNTIASGEAVPRKSCSTISSPPKTTENGLYETSNRTPAIEDMRIPLPPCRSHQPRPRRSTFWKPFRRQQDPFLVAYKECTKTPTFDKKTGVGFNSITSKTKVRFSCMTSIDARDDHFLKPSMPPRLPHPSNPSLTANK